MKKYGLDYHSLKEINPRLIMCSVSGFGQDGPYAKHTSFDIIAQAQSGVMAMTGEPDGPPEYVGNYFGDPNAGIHGALAICAALFHRAMTGEGQYIDVSQLEALVYLDYISVPRSYRQWGNQNWRLILAMPHRSRAARVGPRCANISRIGCRPLLMMKL